MLNVVTCAQEVDNSGSAHSKPAKGTGVTNFSSSGTAGRDRGPSSFERTIFAFLSSVSLATPQLPFLHIENRVILKVQIIPGS